VLPDCGEAFKSSGAWISEDVGKEGRLGSDAGVSDFRFASVAESLVATVFPAPALAGGMLSFKPWALTEDGMAEGVPLAVVGVCSSLATVDGSVRFNLVGWLNSSVISQRNVSWMVSTLKENPTNLREMIHRSRVEKKDHRTDDAEVSLRCSFSITVTESKGKDGKDTLKACQCWSFRWKIMSYHGK
jgi:hypothetical protein